MLRNAILSSFTQKRGAFSFFILTFFITFAANCGGGKSKR